MVQSWTRNIDKSRILGQISKRCEAGVWKKAKIHYSRALFRILENLEELKVNLDDGNKKINELDILPTHKNIQILLEKYFP